MRSCCLAGLPANNAFPLVSHFRVIGALYTCRPDLVAFVNGLPVVVIKLKKPGVPARAAFDDNLTHYKAEISQLFWINALLIVLDGTDRRRRHARDLATFFAWPGPSMANQRVLKTSRWG